MFPFWLTESLPTQCSLISEQRQNAFVRNTIVRLHIGISLKMAEYLVKSTFSGYFTVEWNSSLRSTFLPFCPSCNILVNLKILISRLRLEWNFTKEGWIFLVWPYNKPFDINIYIYIYSQNIYIYYTLFFLHVPQHCPLYIYLHIFQWGCDSSADCHI